VETRPFFITPLSSIVIAAMAEIQFLRLYLVKFTLKTRKNWISAYAGMVVFPSANARAWKNNHLQAPGFFFIVKSIA